MCCFAVQHQFSTEVGCWAFKVTDLRSMFFSLVLCRHGQDLTSPHCACSRRDSVTEFAEFAFCNMSGTHVTSLCAQGGKEAVQQMSANVDNMICSIDFVRKLLN